MKNKLTKINSLQDLGKVISFKPIDKQAYGEVGRVERDGDNIKWIADDNGNWRIINLPKNDDTKEA